MKVNKSTQMRECLMLSMIFLLKLAPKLDKEIPTPKRNRDPTYYLKSRVPVSFIISPTTPKEIIDIISSLDNSKSSGPCCISTKMLKLVSSEVSSPLSDIYNSYFNDGVFPECNKICKGLIIKAAQQKT